MAGEKASIELVLPFRAEYVSVARLTASGIASRAGFDIETVEDIKVALSEVCNKLVTKGSEMTGRYRIIFDLTDGGLKVTFLSEHGSMSSLFREETDELGISIISALMDDLKIPEDDSFILQMSKTVEENE